MRGNGGAGGGQRRETDPVGRALRARDARHLHRREVLVERAAVPEVLLGATDAAVAGLDREREALVPPRRGARVVRGGSLAADLVETVALARALVVELLDELARVEVRAAIAFVVHALAVEH